MEDFDDEIAISSPHKLYSLCLDSVLDCACTLAGIAWQRTDILCLPATVLADLYEKIFDVIPFSIAEPEWFDLHTFNLLLQVKTKRMFMIECTQWLLNAGCNIQKQHLNSFKRSVVCYTLQHASYCRGTEEQRVELVNIGLRMAEFLNDGGWFDYSTSFLNLTETLFKKVKSREDMSQLLELYGLKLYATTSFYNFPTAAETYQKICKVLTKCKKLKLFKALAEVYCNISIYYFVHNRYEEAYLMARNALDLISTGLSKKTIIKILRQMSKTCTQKKCFAQGWLLISQAIVLGQSIPLFPLLADIKMDYAYFMLNSDQVDVSVASYRDVRDLRLGIYRSNNINIAIANEDLAYALYIHEYSSGNFSEAEKFSELALDHMKSLLPADHYFQSSVKRVRALILEEIAIESQSNDEKNVYLKTAEKLHKSALKIILKLLGENNLETAKHYGNLGRLYQTMGKFEKSEQFQRKAINLKEQLFGPNDYEVGLSVGHLASLYSYHMKKYKQAEKLYLRSIAINIRVFGLNYSSLEYDYKGLIHVYKKTCDVENVILYKDKLREWKERRSNILVKYCSPKIMSPNKIIRSFAEYNEEELAIKEERAKLADSYQRALDNLLWGF